jgi:hypothetical protein
MSVNGSYVDVHVVHRLRQVARQKFTGIASILSGKYNMKKGTLIYPCFGEKLSAVYINMMRPLQPPKKYRQQ